MSQNFKRINHPLTIRKVRGKLIVNVNSANEPVTIIRQTSHNELEVHMRNGSTFVEKFSLKEIQNGQHFQTILEMAGMREYLVFFNVKFYFDNMTSVGKVFLRSDEEQIDYVNDLVKSCYPPNSYIDRYVSVVNPMKVLNHNDGTFELSAAVSIMCRDEDIEQMVKNLSALCYSENTEKSSIVAQIIDQNKTLQSFVAAQDSTEKLSYYLTEIDTFINQLCLLDGDVFYSEPQA